MGDLQGELENYYAKFAWQLTVQKFWPSNVSRFIYMDILLFIIFLFLFYTGKTTHTKKKRVGGSVNPLHICFFTLYSNVFCICDNFNVYLMLKLIKSKIKLNIFYYQLKHIKRRGGCRVILHTFYVLCLFDARISHLYAGPDYDQLGSLD